MGKNIYNSINYQVKTFIQNKVKQLGSIEATKKLYSNNYIVSQYANRVAQEFFVEGVESSKIIIGTNVPQTTPVEKQQITPPIMDRDEYLAALGRKRQRDNQNNGIPEYEEGIPKPGWCNDEDWKKMRSGDFADMKRRQRE